jgi:aspartate carbamoyltransferase catalytic subunit
VELVAPATLLPIGVENWPVTVSYDLDATLAGAPDIVMMLRIQSERMHAAFFPNAREYSREWGLTDERFSRLRADSMVMHPGPMNRGLEISARAADSAQSTVLDQVANGVSIRMAVLYLALSGEHDTAATPAASAYAGFTTLTAAQAHAVASAQSGSPAQQAHQHKQRDGNP